ncbi:DNA ligase 1-like [Ornithodoros turicata]|uniref:DNA ligase 1-like n=1 Tax=Ornithodoros turicata TaxID=34597 RepID=UPI00313A4C18
MPRNKPEDKGKRQENDNQANELTATYAESDSSTDDTEDETNEHSQKTKKKETELRGEKKKKQKKKKQEQEENYEAFPPLGQSASGASKEHTERPQEDVTDSSSEQYADINAALKDLRNHYIDAEHEPPKDKGHCMRTVFHKYECLIRSLDIQRATERARRKEVERTAKALNDALQQVEIQNKEASIFYAEITQINKNKPRPKPARIASATVKPKQGKSLKNLAVLLKQEITEADILLTDATIRPAKSGLLIVESRKKEDLDKIEQVFQESELLTEAGSLKINRPPPPTGTKNKVHR